MGTMSGWKHLGLRFLTSMVAWVGGGGGGCPAIKILFPSENCVGKDKYQETEGPSYYIPLQHSGWDCAPGQFTSKLYTCEEDATLPLSIDHVS